MEMTRYEPAWVAEPISKWGHKCKSKQYRTFLWFELTIVTLQELKYDVINFCQNVYAILCNVLLALNGP